MIFNELVLWKISFHSSIIKNQNYAEAYIIHCSIITVRFIDHELLLFIIYSNNVFKYLIKSNFDEKLVFKYNAKIKQDI